MLLLLVYVSYFFFDNQFILHTPDPLINSESLLDIFI